MSGSYSMLRNTWIYQDLKQEIQRDVEKYYIEELKRVLLAIVQARFPRIEIFVRQFIEGKNERELLQKLIIQIGSARLEKDARQSVSSLMREYSSG